MSFIKNVRNIFEDIKIVILYCVLIFPLLYRKFVSFKIPKTKNPIFMEKHYFDLYIYNAYISYFSGLFYRFLEISITI